MQVKKVMWMNNLKYDLHELQKNNCELQIQASFPFVANEA